MCRQTVVGEERYFEVQPAEEYFAQSETSACAASGVDTDVRIQSA